VNQGRVNVTARLVATAKSPENQRLGTDRRDADHGRCGRDRAGRQLQLVAQAAAVRGAEDAMQEAGWPG
jgi:hypothetical protein